MTTTDKIITALQQWRAKTPAAIERPTQLLLDDDLYDAMLEAFREHGMHTPSHPQYEEERMEFRGVKLYRQQAAGILYLP